MSTSKNNLNYTDLHDVDEDMTGIIITGGEWLAIEYNGAFRRNMGNYPSSILDSVASSNMEKFSNYSDAHDVDEDIASFSILGGYYQSSTSKVGLMYRDMINITSDVASSNISKLIKYYTDTHDVDEDSRTFTIQGGCWLDQNQAGTPQRYMWYATTTALSYVASRCRHPKIILIIRIRMMSTKTGWLPRFKVLSGPI